MRRYPPICVFAYNRPDHISQTLIALSKNFEIEKAPVFIFCDEAKKESDIINVKDTRSEVERLKHLFSEVKIVHRQENYGLAKSIVSSVTEVINEYETCIIVEDDIVTDPEFYNYMCRALDFYQGHKDVYHVSAYLDPISIVKSNPFFIPTTSCWGWATWKDKWNSYESDPISIFNELKDKKLLSEFDFNKSCLFLSQLSLNISNDLNTWAIKWYGSVYLKGGLSLHPPYSLVKNIGMDGSGTNCKAIGTSKYDTIKKSLKNPCDLYHFPEDVTYLESDKEIFSYFYGRLVNSSKFSGLYRTLLFYLISKPSLYSKLRSFKGIFKGWLTWKK